MKSMEDDIDIYADLPDFGPEFSKNVSIKIGFYS